MWKGSTYGGQWGIDLAEGLACLTGHRESLWGVLGSKFQWSRPSSCGSCFHFPLFAQLLRKRSSMERKNVPRPYDRLLILFSLSFLSHPNTKQNLKILFSRACAVLSEGPMSWKVCRRGGRSEERAGKIVSCGSLRLFFRWGFTSEMLRVGKEPASFRGLPSTLVLGRPEKSWSSFRRWENWGMKEDNPYLIAAQVSSPSCLPPVGICPGWIMPWTGLLVELPCLHSFPHLGLSLCSPGGVTACAMANSHCGCGVPLVSVPFLVCGSAQAVGSHPS